MMLMIEAENVQDEMIKIVIISEVINLKPTEGIRKFGREIADAFEISNRFLVYRIGFSNNVVEGGNALSKIREIIKVRRDLKAINADITIYIPSSPRIMNNLLKFSLWQGKSKWKAIILLQPPKGKAPFAKRILRGVQVFTQFNSNQLPRSLRTHSNKLIPSGVNVSNFKPVTETERKRLRMQLGFTPTDKIVISVGHLTEGRNLDLIMRLSESVTARIVFVTSGISWDDPKIKIKLDESGVILLDRYFERIQEIYSIADCYFFPTRDPDSAIGMPLSILEALSCNIPVVSSRFGILNDTLKEEGGVAFFDDDETAIRLVQETISNTRHHDYRTVALDFDWSKIAELIISEMVNLDE
jgi:glycosyltransferase involved in cell wall biosynthesis